ncbi:hypothetical protein HKBW3S03_01522 [Candidatus Hakubella thermalkaliphila]|uniref:TolB protein n=1 Tax=Candidatus Hakubella thermalkaliphila TaxID=2754717 RepID=A0A6V8NI83_9ACTN|nr:hypothetical protein HKBW3S03_01522 [Candidatus Hakubella thermalkaliphila]
MFPCATIMNIDGSAKRELPIPFPQIMWPENFRWSPDGKRIAFEGHDLQCGQGDIRDEGWWGWATKIDR